MTEVCARLENAFDNIYLLEPTFTSWGGFSLTEVLLRSIAFSIHRSADWSHLILLSEQHLPLYPADEIAARLIVGQSIIHCNKFTEMHEGAKADIQHRFGMRYRELAGVGPFVEDFCNLPAAFFDTLYHGSQWCVLARDACERLDMAQSNFQLIEPFRRCLISDEMLVPTFLLGSPVGEGLQIKVHNASFIAYPHLSGTNDLVFTERNFYSAISEGYLFIRKRPVELPPSVDQFLESRSSLTEAEMRTALGVHHITLSPIFGLGAADTELRLRETIDEVASTSESLSVEYLYPTDYANVPRIYTIFRRQSWHPDDLMVALLSEDFLTFNVLIIWRGGYENGLGAIELGDFVAAVSKARVHGIAFTREVFLKNQPSESFVEIGSENCWACLKEALLRALEKADAFLTILRSATSEYSAAN